METVLCRPVMMMLLLLLAGQHVCSALEFRGYNLGLVVVRFPESTHGTLIWYDGNYKWVEEGSGRSALWTETGRDKWSVFAEDKIGTKLQIDLHQQKVIYSRSTGSYALKIEPKSELSAPGLEIDGYNLVLAEVENTGGKSEIVYTGEKKWEDRQENGLVHHYEEYKRDRNSVYLKHENGSQLQIELPRRKVKFTRHDGKSWDHYDILFINRGKVE